MNTEPIRALARQLALISILAAGCGPRGPVEAPELQPGEGAVEYPVELWDMGIEGETTLMMHVTETGAVDSVYVHTTSGIPDFDSAALEAGHRMRFAPARRDGERIAAWTRVPVRFQRTAEPPVGVGNRDEPGQGGD